MKEFVCTECGYRNSKGSLFDGNMYCDECNDKLYGSKMKTTTKYGVFYTSTDDCTYSADILKCAFSDSTTAELLVMYLNEKSGCKYPVWTTYEIEVLDAVTDDDIQRIAGPLLKEQGFI